jgi:hypothetical protein
MLDMDLTGGPKNEKDDTYVTKHVFLLSISHLLLTFFTEESCYPPAYPPEIIARKETAKAPGPAPAASAPLLPRVRSPMQLHARLPLLALLPLQRHRSSTKAGADARGLHHGGVRWERLRRRVRMLGHRWRGHKLFQPVTWARTSLGMHSQSPERASSSSHLCEIPVLSSLLSVFDLNPLFHSCS